MKPLIRLLSGLLLGAALITAATAAETKHEDGVTYDVLATPRATSADAGQVEVVEFFWYGCPHCYALEPYLENWLAHKPKNVKFVRIPVAEGFGWAEPMAQAFYTEQTLGVVDKLHKAVFDEIHQQRHILKTKDDFKQFFEKHGVNGKDFDAAWNSFAVKLKVKRAKHEQESYNIAGVPTIAVAGRYTATLVAGQGPEQLPHAIDVLVKKAEKNSQ